MEENTNQEQNPNTNKKSGKGLFIVIGLMAIIIAGLVGYIYYTNTNKTEETANTTTSNSSTKEDKKSDKKADKEKDENKEKDEKDKKADKDDKEEKEDKKENESKEDKNEEKDSNSGSSFGKKDKNKETNTKTDDQKDTTSSEPSTASVSNDWTSGEFVFDGKKYKLNCNYKDYVDNGWSVDLAKYGYADGYILNKNDKTYSTVSLENSKYEKPYVNIGFINLSDKAIDIKDSQIWAISVSNSGSYHTKVDFELPGGIKYGSKLADIEKAYGKPEDASDIYRAEELKYTTYTYRSKEKNKPQLRLTIYDDEGLVEFDYKLY